jgi:prevent-host-death family protein
MTTQTCNVQEAKENLPSLLEKVASGAEVIITEQGKPLARISRIDERVGIRFGVLKGRAKVSEDFDAPLPDEVLSDFEGKESGCNS